MSHRPSHPGQDLGQDEAIFLGDKYASSNSKKQHSQLLACLDDDSNRDRVASHAVALALALGLPVAFAQVVEGARHADTPIDPVEWHLRLGKHREQLDRMIAQQKDLSIPVESVLLTGSSDQELCGWIHEHAGALLVLATHSGNHQKTRKGLGTTAQKILSDGMASLLLVPPEAKQPAVVPYQKLLVPLDGSFRAESVLPVALRIAHNCGAEIVLIHVLAQLDTIEAQSFKEDADELCSKLKEQNEQHARSYLEKLRSRFRAQGFIVNEMVISDGDPRDRLRQVALDLGADLIVVSSHGRSGLSDVACGSVTAYLADHAPCPLLIIRPSFQLGQTKQFASNSDDVDTLSREIP